MSLCIGIQHGEGYIVAVDGRGSLTYNGVDYCTDKHLKKYVIRNNKFYVTFGECNTINKFQNLCAANNNDTIKDIFDNVITEKRKSYYLESLTCGAYNGLLLAVFEIDVAGKKIHEINYGGEGYDKITVDMPNFFTFGARSDKMAEIIANTPKDTYIFDVFTRAFDKINSYEVGGVWELFYITPTKLKYIGQYKNNDDGILYTPQWLLDKISKTNEMWSSAHIYGAQVYGGAFNGGIYRGLGAVDENGDTVEAEAKFYGAEYFNTDGTTKLILGMDGNLGDLELIREADGTTVFQVRDEINSTALCREGNTFLYTTGETTYPTGTWDFKNVKEIKNLNVVAVFG